MTVDPTLPHPCVHVYAVQCMAIHPGGQWLRADHVAQSSSLLQGRSAPGAAPGRGRPGLLWPAAGRGLPCCRSWAVPCLAVAAGGAWQHGGRRGANFFLAADLRFLGSAETFLTVALDYCSAESDGSPSTTAERRARPAERRTDPRVPPRDTAGDGDRRGTTSPDALPSTTQTPSGSAAAFDPGDPGRPHREDHRHTVQRVA